MLLLHIIQAATDSVRPPQEGGWRRREDVIDDGGRDAEWVERAGGSLGWRRGYHGFYLPLRVITH